MQYSFVIIDDNAVLAEAVMLLFEDFPEYYHTGTAQPGEEAIDLILEVKPQLVFLSVKKKSKHGIPISFINELYRYLDNVPYFVLIADSDEYAFEAIKAGFFDYIVSPVKVSELRKTLLKFQKEIPLSGKVAPSIVENLHENSYTELPDRAQINKEGMVQGSDVDIQICIKSYGDYQFIALKDVVYLEADNNTTDFHLVNGKKISAYKTLKHYENNLPSFFYRIHNSFVVNSNYVSRINTGKSLCYLNNNEISLPFTKTFKENIDTIIRKIAPEFI